MAGVRLTMAEAALELPLRQFAMITTELVRRGGRQKEADRENYEWWHRSKTYCAVPKVFDASHMLRKTTTVSPRCTRSRLSPETIMRADPRTPRPIFLEAPEIFSAQHFGESFFGYADVVIGSAPFKKKRFYISRAIFCTHAYCQPKFPRFLHFISKFVL